jgi:hypothetical protein
MSIPPSTGRRKTRLVREEAPPHDLVVLVRAAGFDLEGTLADLVRDARYSGDTYAIDRPGGRKEVLFGVSVFAVRPGGTVAGELEKFSASPHYLAMTVGRLQAAGFEVVATGTAGNHYDIQLVSGVPGDEPPPGVDNDELASGASALLELAGPLRANPAYTGEQPE